MPKPRDHVPRRLLAAAGHLSPGDVRMLTRARFWSAPGQPADIYGAAMPAMIGLMALAHIPQCAIPLIELADALPDGSPRTIRVPIRDRLQEIRLTPAAAILAAKWKKDHRPTECPSSKLFVGRNGDDIPVGSFDFCLKPLSTALGLPGRFGTAASDFFVSRFHSHPDHHLSDTHALTAYRRLFCGLRINPSATAAQLRLVIERADPFPDAGKRFCSEERALEAALSLGTLLPESYGGLFEPSPDAAAAGLPEDHPLVVELAATAFSRHNKTRGQQYVDIYLRHRAEIESRSADKSLPPKEAAKVFGLANAGYVHIVRQARGRDVALVAGPLLGRAKSRPSMTEEEAARVGRIEAMLLANAKSGDDPYSLLRRHAAFVFGLCRDRKISFKDGASLLDTHKGDFRRMKLDHEAGVFDHWCRPRPTDAESRVWTQFIRARLSERQADQSDKAFIRQLRVKYDLPISEPVAIRAIRPPATVSERPPHRIDRKPQAALSAEDVKDMQAVAADAFEETCGRRKRPAWLEAAAPVVFQKVRAKKMFLHEARVVLGLTGEVVGELYQLYNDGELHLAFKARSKAENRSIRDKVLADMKKRGAELGFGPFLREFRRRHGVFVSRSALLNLIHDFERQNGRLPEGHATGGRRTKGPDTPLSKEERLRLKGIAADRPGSDDEVSRSILTSDGAFLMKMIDDCKISSSDAATLARLSLPNFSLVRRDFATGSTGRHCLPQPVGEDRRRQVAEVSAAAEASDASLSNLRFAALLGPHITLSHGTIKYLRDCIIKSRIAAQSGDVAAMDRPT